MLGLFWYFVLLGCAFGRVLFLFFFVVFFVLSRAANSWALIFFLSGALHLRCAALHFSAVLAYITTAVALRCTALHRTALHYTVQAKLTVVRFELFFDLIFSIRDILFC